MEAKHHLLKDSWLLLGNFESFSLNSSHFEVENKVSGTYDCKEPSKLFKTYRVLKKKHKTLESVCHLLALERSLKKVPDHVPKST